MGPSTSGGSDAAAGLEGITNTKTVALLQQEHQQMIVMSQASKTVTVVAKASVVTPSSVVKATEVSSSSSSDSSSSSSGSSTGDAAPPPVAAPDPGTAQSIAYNMLSSFGFSTSQFSCLQDLWQRESGWSYDAENPSGAYGIPQSLPASKMASAGSDYLTNPATQIKWGLGYIQSVYGTPCAAWDFEEANNYY
jgi:resuscitation-promoting factor RpfB